VRLSSLGDVVHALPAASALRDAFPDARIDWVIDARWQRLLEANPDLNEVIAYDRKQAGSLSSCIRKLRAARYTCAIDFQGLYKSALLALASGAPRRIGFQSSYAREGLVAMLYTDRLNPLGPHKVDHNRTLVERAGAKLGPPRFPLAIRSEDDDLMTRNSTTATSPISTS
jgi:ADP-heptose:LPS heptosyltransferase